MARQPQITVDHGDALEQIVVSVPIPRDALTVVAPPPVLLSQRNVEQVTGIPSDSYLRMLRAADFNLTILAEGKLRLVEREAFVAWLGRCRRSTARPVERAPAVSTHGDDADAIAREMGLTPKHRRGRCRG